MGRLTIKYNKTNFNVRKLDLLKICYDRGIILDPNILIFNGSFDNDILNGKGYIYFDNKKYDVKYTTNTLIDVKEDLQWRNKELICYLTIFIKML